MLTLRRNAVALELQSRVSDEGADAALQHAESRLSSLAAEASEDASTERLCWIAALLNHQDLLDLSDRNLNDLLQVGDALIKTLNPRGKDLADLVADFRQGRALTLARRGSSLSALWHLGNQAADTFGGAFLGAQLALQRGSADIALGMLGEADKQASSSAERSLSMLSRARATRLTGRRAEALEILKDLETHAGDEPSLQREIEWERLVSVAVSSGNLAPMLAAVTRDGPQRSYSRQLEAALWGYASKGIEWIKKVGRTDSIRRAFSTKDAERRRDAALFSSLQKLERCYDSDWAIEARLGAAEDVLLGVDLLQTVEQKLLAQLAVARWLTRQRRTTLAAVALAEYQGLCRKLSSGTSADVFGWAPDAPLAKIASTPSGSAESFTRIESSRAARFAAISAIATGTLGAAMRLKLRSMFASEEEIRDARAELAARAAKMVGRRADLLRGPVTKLAQLAAWLENSPDRPFFDNLRRRGTWVSWDFAEVRRAIERELGRPIAEVFAAVQERPLASASIGQVHGAELKDGTRCVVKVQYDDVERAIAGDFDTLARLSHLIRFLFPGVDVGALIKANRGYLGEECDYLLEAKKSARFRRLFVDDPRVVVPPVLENLSTRRMLVSRRVDAEDILTFAEGRPMAERSLAAATIYQTTLRALFVHGFLHADLHPENFGFLENGKVVFFDLAMAEEVPAGRLKRYRALALAALEGSDEDVLREVRLQGYGDVLAESPRVAEFTRFHWVGPLLQTQPYRFDQEHIRRFREVSGIGTARQGLFRLLAEDALLPRFFLTLATTLATLNAEVDLTAFRTEMSRVLRTPGTGQSNSPP